MKKIIICMFAVAALVVTSCGNKSDAETDAASAVTELQTKLEANDAEGFSELVTKSQEAIESLMKEGKIDEAKAYAESLQNFINENAETIKNVTGNNETVNSIVDAIQNIPTGFTGTLDEAKENLQNAAQEVGEGAKGALEELKEEAIAERDKYKNQAKEAAEEAKQKVNDAANQAVEDAKQKANDAVNKAANDAANKLKNAFKK